MVQLVCETEKRNKITVLKQLFGCAMAQAFSHWPLTLKAWILSQAVNVSVVMNKMALRQVFLQALQFYLVFFIPLMFHTRSFINH